MLKKTIISLTLSSCILTSSFSHATSNDVTQNFGLTLPYKILIDEMENAQGKKVEIRNGGFGSDMTRHPINVNQFYALTDRGANSDYPEGSLGKGKIFPVAEYTPRIGLFEITDSGDIKLLKVITLKRPDGKSITGLPNTSAFGGTGETPYDIKGNPIVVNKDEPFNAISNPIKLDDYGLDPEGLVALKDGTFWISDEYGPHLVHYDANGIEIGRINAFIHDMRTDFSLPQELGNRRANRGMEGLTITPDETTLVGIMQSTMANPDKHVQNSDVTRIVAINIRNGQVSQYLYKQEKNQNSNSGISALSQNEFVVIERDGKFALKDSSAMKHIYRVDLSKATDLEAVSVDDNFKQDEKLGLMVNGKTIEQFILDNGWDAAVKLGITPANKELVVDVVERLHYPHDKLEGIMVMDNSTLAIINDDDFGIWATDGELEQKFLDPRREIEDNNKLYFIDNVNLENDQH